jgi:hypothetical protein
MKEQIGFRSPELAKVIDQLKDGTFSKNGDPGEFKDVVNNLLYHDRLPQH